MFLCLGALLLAWGLLAAASGAEEWNAFSAFCSGVVGFGLLVAFSWALLFHLCNGIQHLFRDGGMGFDTAQRDHMHTPSYFATGWIVVAASVVLTALVWACLWLGASGGAA
jgi:succinate dehydrogenase / fumarate reductase cytochrome b subunit